MNLPLRRFAIVFGLWTLVALCAGSTDYLFRYTIGSPASFWSVFKHPLTEQWIWAALTPPVFLIARRFPLGRRGRTVAFAVHTGCFLCLSLLHCAVAEAFETPLSSLPPGYHGSTLELRFLKELYSDIWMYWPLVCIQALIDSHAHAREREQRAVQLEAQLTHSHLALLRAQIQPHFLFNTLHSISALLRIDARAAQDMVADLAELLRNAFAEPMVQETTLRRELDLIGCYVRIQSRRFSDRLKLSCHLEPDTLEAAVPALVLQSLVENSVIHGIAPADHPCRLEIRSWRSRDQLVLQVDDNGVGLQQPHRPGVGLSNARKRLQQLYGEYQSIHLTGRPEGGVSVTVRIPLRIRGEDLAGAALQRSFV
jgi:LytS/YehU family sensor histidine kinase